MLNWLRRRHDTTPPTRQPRAGRPIWRVTFDDSHVNLITPDGTSSQIAWAQLGCVGIMTTPDGPAEPDLFWLLQPLDRRMSLVFPMGADGEHELLHEMQIRLHGFDNMTVVEAMSSTDSAGFVVWQPKDASAES